MPRPITALGTDGYGLSENRAALRDHFEVDARFITLAVLSALARDGAIGTDLVNQAIEELEIVRDKIDPLAK